jgi:hypothetical protein
MGTGAVLRHLGPIVPSYNRNKKIMSPAKIVVEEVKGEYAVYSKDAC